MSDSSYIYVIGTLLSRRKDPVYAMTLHPRMWTGEESVAQFFDNGYILITQEALTYDGERHLIEETGLTQDQADKTRILVASCAANVRSRWGDA